MAEPPASRPGQPGSQAPPAAAPVMPAPVVVDWSKARVIVTGGAGFLGRHIVDVLRSRGVGPDRLFVPRRAVYDLTTPSAASAMYREAFPAARADVVIHAAGAVGGLGAHRLYPGRYFADNLAMGLHVVDQARCDGLYARGGRLVLVGSMTSYPASAAPPFREESLWSGYPEPGTAPYAIAKLALLEMFRAYHAQHGARGAYVIPTNLYGPFDNFDPATSHAAAAIIRRCLEARRRGDPSIVNWGTGSPTREFLFAPDAAEAVVRAAERDTGPDPINISPGREVTIRGFIEAVCRVAGYAGRVEWDLTKPDGQARRCLDPSRAAALLDWRAPTPLDEGLRRTIDWYSAHGPSA